MIVLEIATIGEIEFLEFATLSEIRDSFTVYKTQPVDRGRPRYQLTTLSVSRNGGTDTFKRKLEALTGRRDESREWLCQWLALEVHNANDVQAAINECLQAALVALDAQARAELAKIDSIILP